MTSDASDPKINWQVLSTQTLIVSKHLFRIIKNISPAKDIELCSFMPDATNYIVFNYKCSKKRLNRIVSN